MRIRTMAVALLGCVLVLGLASARAQDKTSFADKKVVLQLSDAAPDKQALVLNVASNLLKFYGPDKVKVEVVAFGPGLNLLLANNAEKDRIQSMDVSGVRFSACENTIAAVTKKTGKEPVLVKQAQRVPAGVVRIVDLTSQGYTLIRP